MTNISFINRLYPRDMKRQRVRACTVGLLTIFLMTLATSCLSKEPTTPITKPGEATLFYNAAVITMNPEHPQAKALSVRNGNIVAIGSLGEVEAATGPIGERIDLLGKTLLPGFIDAHGHLSLIKMFMGFENLAPPPVGPVNKIHDLLALMKTKAQSTPPRQWVMGRGYDDSLLAEQRHPTREDLDKVSTEHPVFILHVSAHLASCNSKCLEIIGVDKNTADMPGGKFRRMPDGQTPNGVMEEHAMHAAMLPLMQSSPGQGLQRLKQAQQRLASFGITTAQDGAASSADWQLLTRAAETDQLILDTVAYPLMSEIEKTQSTEWPVGQYRKNLKLGGVKLVLDGSPQGKTAWLSQPYFHPPHGKSAGYSGYPALTDKALEGFLSKFFAQGLQVLAHANGDAAAEQLINSVEKVTHEQGGSDRRTVLIHAQTLRNDQLDRIGKLNIMPSYFVAHTFYWGDWHRDSVLGEERAKRISPLKSTLERGIPFTIHNDSPVVPPDMSRLLWTAVNRRTRSGQVLGAEERINVIDALRGVTILAAYQNFEEDIKGSLEPGKLADMVVLSDNPLLMDPMTLDQLEVLMTYKAGKVIYSK